MFRKWLSKLGCLSCHAIIDELEKEIDELEDEVAHWKRLALEYRRPHR